MIKESAKPSTFKHRNNLLGGDSKTMRSMDQTAFESYKSKFKSRNVNSPPQTTTQSFSESSARKLEYKSLKEQLQKITLDLDNALCDVSQPLKTRRTRKQRNLNTVNNTSRSSCHVQDDACTEWDTKVDKDQTQKQINGEQVRRNVGSNALKGHCNTAREKSKFVTGAKENKATKGKGAKVGVAVHRRCLTRMVQGSGKEKTQLANRQGKVNETVCSSMSKRNTKS
eukprot:TRINITY_DN3566_c0_g1_i1.p1 TRINITY_DN3566_c0_g1~~TRINITY_DN3566_c0_g1_i1.p1  ORF type:complete len:226 (-),score=51.20 TRINITY_DN3566_c0_g1_i1:157-834(-)